MTKIDGRYVEDVQEFVVEKLDRWLSDATQDEELEVIAATVQDIRYSIVNGVMLTKLESKWLSELLSDHLGRAMKEFMEYGLPIGNIMAVDSWGIYTDAWAIYCRPGTYTI